MLDLSKDQRCQSIEKKLDFYAEKARQWQIDRRRYVDHNYGNKFQFSDNKPYPYDDDTERRMLNDINRYLLTFDGQDRAQVNGHLLWKYKEYFSQPFAKHAIRLVTMSVMEHPLSDNDKAKFLEYIFSSGKQYEFDNFILYKLASFDPDKNPQINNRLYTKAIGYFDSHPRKNEKFVHLVYGMFKSFTGRVQQVSPEAVVNYAKIYFAMTERTSKKLSAAPLLRLLMKTPTALAEREQWGYDGIDTEAVKQVFASYKEHVMKEKTFNPRLGQQMQELARFIIKDYCYGKSSAEALIAAVRPPAVDEQGHKIRRNGKTEALEQFGNDLQSYFTTLHDQRNLNYLQRENPLKGIDIDAADFKPEQDLVRAYASYLFDYAAYNTGEDVGGGKLMQLLQKNAAVRRLGVIPATLFSEEKKIKAVDKELVLDIAKTYASSVGKSGDDSDSLNYSLGEAMLGMFKDIVVNYNYAPKEVEALTGALTEGSGGADYLQEMSKRISGAYVSSKIAAERNSRFL